MNTNEEQKANMTICKQHQTVMIDNFVNCLGRIMNFARCEKCEEEQAIKEKEEEKKRKEHYDKLALEKYHKNIPLRYKDAKLSDFQSIKPVIDWCEKPTDFLFVFGKCGTGKTHLSAAIAYYMRDKEIECGFSVTSDIFLELRNSFNCQDDRLNEFSIISKYSTKNIYVFDDIGTQKMSEYTLESWYNIINTRYGEKLPTVFTSNMSLSELSSYMSDRIASRLASGIVFELKGIDKRIKKG